MVEPIEAVRRLVKRGNGLPSDDGGESSVIGSVGKGNGLTV